MGRRKDASRWGWRWQERWGSGVGVKVAEDVGGLQAVTEHEGFVGEELGGGALGDELAGTEQESARAKLDDELQVVRGDNLGHRDLAEEVDQFAAAAEVETAGGLVKDENGGIAGEDSGKAGAALSAGAQVVGGSVVQAGQADLGKGAGDAVADFAVIEAELLGAEGDILEDGGAEELVVGVLKEQANLAADGGEIGRGNGLAHGGNGGGVGEALG